MRELGGTKVTRVGELALTPTGYSERESGLCFPYGQLTRAGPDVGEAGEPALWV